MKAMRQKLHRGLVACCLASALTVPYALVAQQARGGGRQTQGQASAQAPAESDVEAARLIDKAQELLAQKDEEGGVKMLQNVLDQYPRSRLRFKAHLILGRHFVETQKYQDAIRYLRGLAPIEQSEIITPEEKEWLLESQYLTGVAYFHMRQYGNSFTAFRGITRDHPNTVWANQAYYYIGMCHFALQNWVKAIEALTMVGTHIDPESPAAKRVEAGRRMYIKIADADLPILMGLNKELKVELQSKSGDRETIVCVPLSGKSDMAVGSIPTATGQAKPGDNILQVIGGDQITVRYIDSVDGEGKSNVPREAVVQVISSADLRFTLGTFDEKAIAAFLGQPIFILVEDLDMDTSPAADKVTVKLVSRYKVEQSDESAFRAVNVDKLMAGDQYEERDEVALELVELGEGQFIRTGRFGGRVDIKPAVEGAPVDKNDGALACAIEDEIIATYVDDVNIEGEVRRNVVAKIMVTGEIDGKPISTQNLVTDPVVKAKKDLVEATAFLELTRIFRSMGLMKKAVEKSQEGLARVESVILARGSVPNSLKEQAFKIKWELYIEVEDYQNAIATCSVFSKLYPTSTYADDALMKIGMAKIQDKKIFEGIEILRKVLALPNSGARAEAQFRIAEAMYAQAQAAAQNGMPNAAQARSQAMQEYKKCAENFPDTDFAGQSLARLVDYYVETKDYSQADDLLGQIFMDHPDARFLDSMLLKWVIVCYYMGNYDKAYEKCNQLLFDYPDSDFAAQAKKILPKLEQKVKGGTTAPAEGESGQ